MTDSPKLAIVVACYNYEAYVEKAIRSVLDQRRSDCELVVVDDGSSDRSWEIITRTGATAFRIENRGQRGACLFGFDKTTAPFVLFLDADDELQPGSIGTIIDHLDPEVAKLQYSLARIDARGDPIEGVSEPFDTFRDRTSLANRVLKKGIYRCPPTSGNVFRRDVCELLREAEYDNIVDGVILFAAPLFGDIVSLSDYLGRYRIHDRNESGLGRLPDAASLERDINRFVARMEHLRAIIRRLRPDQPLFDPRAIFYFRERSFYLEIERGRRPRLIALLELIAALLPEPIAIKNKTAMLTFFILAAALPPRRGKALLAYRLKTGDRTLLGFGRAIVGW